MKIIKIIIAFIILLTIQSSQVFAQQPAVEIERLNNAIASTPNDEKLYLERGSLYFRNGKFVEALADAQKALAINPKNGAAIILRGNSKTGTGDFDGAISDFSQIITALPTRAFRAYIGRGQAYLQKYDLPNALNDFNKAVEIDPKLVDAYYGRAKVYEKQTDFDKAVNEYSLALPNIPPAQTDELAAGFVLRGKASLSAGKGSQAAADFDRVAKSNTKSFGEAAYLFGQMLYKIKDYANAEKMFARAKEGNYEPVEDQLKKLKNEMQNEVAILKEINSYNARIAALAAAFDVLGNKLRALAEDDYRGKAEVTPLIHQNTATQMAVYSEQLSKFPKEAVLSAELEKSRRSATSALNAAKELNRRTRPYRVAEFLIMAEQNESTKKADVFFNEMKTAKTNNDNAAYNSAKQKWQAEVRITREITVRGMAKMSAFNDSQWEEDRKAYDATLAAYDQQLKL